GKHYGMPIYRLLGGPCRRKVRVYVDAWGRSPEELAEHASRLVKEGYTALRLGPYTERFPDQFHAKMIDDAVARVKAVREAVGNEVDLCVEVHGRAQPYEAIALGKELEKYRILFYEDPILPENIDAMANVAAHVNVPIATGERLYTLYEFRELLVKNAALMVRPDVCLAGGITQTKKIATLAEAFFVGVIPHNPLSPVSTAACVHIDAAIHNFTIQEYSPEDRPPKSELFQPLRLEKGYLLLPEKPGLGLDLDEKAVEKYPWDVNIYDSAPGAEFREDGSLADS
ncbi:MAG: mandelate racemase/muconate lactonizing enzyme family protein, partial [Candidatus Bathyarchaeia archaeon]